VTPVEIIWSSRESSEQHPEVLAEEIVELKERYLSV